MTDANSPHQDAAPKFPWPIACTLLLVAGVAIWMSCKIPDGILTYPDELLTAERSREMLLTGRDTVHFNFRSSFAKPPLQYWLTTFTLPHLANKSVAVRIWPVLYGLLTAAAVGWLAWLFDRRRRWLIPLSVAIFISCPLFATEATRALLDTGLMFFTTAAIGFSQLARRDPRWWLGVAVACWLGALQKIPLIFLVWMIILLARLTTRSERANLHPRWLLFSGLLAALLVSLWPLWQFLNYGMPLAKAFAGDDLGGLLGQGHLGARPYFEVLDGLLLSGWAGGIFAVLAAVAVLLERPGNQMARELAGVALTVVALSVVFNFRSVRYVLPIVPCLCLVLAIFLHDLFERRPRVRVAVLSFIVLFVMGGFIQAAVKMHHRGRDFSGEQSVAQQLGRLQRDGTYTFLIDSAGPKRKLRSIAFYLFHGNLSFPIKRRSLAELRQNAPESPVVAVCAQSDFPLVQEIYPEAVSQLVADDAVCWSTATR